MDQEEKDLLFRRAAVINACFLDGEPAHVYGTLLDFPIVGQLDGPLAVEFSWQAVKRVMNKDGRFSTK